MPGALHLMPLIARGEPRPWGLPSRAALRWYRCDAVSRDYGICWQGAIGPDRSDHHICTMDLVVQIRLGAR
jgi:hypothetical protein